MKILSGGKPAKHFLLLKKKKNLNFILIEELKFAVQRNWYGTYIISLMQRKCCSNQKKNFYSLRNSAYQRNTAPKISEN